MFTLKNYYSKVNEIDYNSLSQSAKQGYDFMTSIKPSYDEVLNDDDIKSMIVSYLELLNIEVKSAEKSSNSGKSRRIPTTKGRKVNTRKRTTSAAKASMKAKYPNLWNEKKVTKPKTEKVPKEKPTKPLIDNTRSGTAVARISPEITFIKRFVNLEGETKTKSQILKFIKDLQKAIAERQISKTSKFGDEIMDIQNALLTIYEKMGETILIETKSEDGLAKMERLQAIANGEVVYWSVYYAKRIINLRGNETKEKAKKLQKEILNRLENDPSFGKEGTVHKTIFMPMYEQLKAYLADSSKIQVSEAVLYGLGNMPPILAYSYKGKRYELRLKEKSLKGVMSSDELRKQTYDKIGFTGELRELLGDMTKGAQIMIKGREKMGKSTLALMLARDLATSYGNVLYVSNEEFGSPTLQDRADRLKAYHSNLSFAPNIPANPGHYEFVFIDSFAKAGLTTSDIEKFRQQYPQTTFFYIFRTTKSGEARGTAENAFEVDVIIDVVDGTATARGRFGGGMMKIFKS